MNGLTATIVIVLLLMLRFGLPLAGIAGLSYLLNRCCDRWDREAEELAAP